MTQSERIGKLLFRYTRMELSERESSELAAWRKADPKNEQAFLEETDPENMRKNFIQMEENKEAARKILQERFPDMLTQRPEPFRIFRLNVHRISAAAGIVLLFALYFLFRNPHSAQSTSDAILFDPDGVATALDDFHRGLMDGLHGIMIKKNEKGVLIYTPRNDSTSAVNRNYKIATRADKLILNLTPSVRISLNANSSVTYPENNHQDTLRVLVSGETYVEVNSPKFRPLEIIVNKGIDSPAVKIFAYNARININSSHDSLSIRTTVLDGTAEIVLSEKTYPLQRGQQALIKMGQMQDVHVSDTNSVIRWIK